MSVVIFIFGGAVDAGVSAGVSAGGAQPAATRESAITPATAILTSVLIFISNSSPHSQEAGWGYHPPLRNYFRD
jgi:hypothetical protein